MELEVLRTKGIPETGVISIRAGNTRRQAQVAALDRPMKFPQLKPQDTSGFKIDVLDLLGSARMTLDGPMRLSHEYNVDLEHATEQAHLHSPPMEVTFAIRRAGEGGGGGDTSATSADESSLRGSLTFENLDLNKDGIVTKEEFEKAMSENKADWVQKRESAARDYLEEHGLVGFMQYLMQSLMKDKPADPYTFLQKQVAMRAAQQRIAAGGEENGLSALLSKLDPEASSVVSVEQLAELEKEASDAASNLRKDNDLLRNTAVELKQEYEKLFQESMSLRQEQERMAADQHPSAQGNLPAKFEGGYGKKAEPIAGETPQLHAYREIALVQDEVSGLAKENVALVEELSRMRSAVDTLRSEIGGLSTSIK